MNHWLWAYLIVGYQIHEPLNATWDVTAMSLSKWQGGTTLPGWVLCTVQMILFTRIIFLSTRNVEMILTHDLGCCCSSANHEFHLSKYACTMNKCSSILERSKKKKTINIITEWNRRIEAHTNAAAFSWITKPVPVVTSATLSFPASINNNHGLIQSCSNNSEAPHSICFKCVKKFMSSGLPVTHSKEWRIFDRLETNKG